MTFTVHPVPGPGAEDVVVAPDGHVYTGTEDGSIFRMSPDGHRIDRVAHTGGRPLGLELFDDGDLLVCDADRGLLVVHLRGRADGPIETLLTHVDGVPMRFCNNAAIAARRHHLVQRLLDPLRHRASGRTTSSRTPAPAGCCAATPTARSRSSSTASPSPTASPSAPTSATSRSPRPAPAPSYAAGSGARGRASGTCSSTTCPATPTTSPAAATA